MRFLKLLYFLPIIIAFASCIDSSIIGDEIIQNDEIKVDFTDNVNIKAKTLKNDSFAVFPNTRNTFILGEIRNETFGYSSASLAMDFTTISALPSGATVADIAIDSLVLSVFVDTSYFYGDTNAVHHIRIYELNENIQLKTTENKTYYSNKNWSHNSEILSESLVVPSLIDTAIVIEPTNDTVKYNKLLRIKLPISLGKKIVQDTSALDDVALFKTNFKGLFIESSVSPNSLIGISKANSTGSLSSSLELYYTYNSKVFSMSFPVSNITPTFKNNYINSEVNNSFDDYAAGAEFLYLQGFTGTKMNIEISGLDTLADKNINKAELWLYTSDYKDVDDLPFRLIAFIENPDSTLTELLDYSYSDTNSKPYFYNGYSEDFDENGIKGRVFKINISAQLKKLLKSKTYSAKIVILPSDRIGNPGFAKFYGTANSKLKTKLKIVFSDNN